MTLNRAHGHAGPGVTTPARAHLAEAGPTPPPPVLATRATDQAAVPGEGSGRPRLLRRVPLTLLVLPSRPTPRIGQAPPLEGVATRVAPLPGAPPVGVGLTGHRPPRPGTGAAKGASTLRAALPRRAPRIPPARPRVGVRAVTSKAAWRHPRRVPGAGRRRVAAAVLPRLVAPPPSHQRSVLQPQAQ